MKKKVAKRKKTIRRVGVVRAVKKPVNWVGMLVGVLLVMGLAYMVYRANMQSVDINKIATGQAFAREQVLGRWAFESSTDFGASGIWRLPVTYKDYNVKMQDGRLVWSGLVNGAQIIAPTVSLDMTEDMRGYGRYVVKVKAEVTEDILARTEMIRRASPTPTPSPKVAPHEFGMRVRLMEVYFDQAAGVNKERQLAEQTLTGMTNTGTQDYEFVFDNPKPRKVTRVRFDLYQLSTTQQAAARVGLNKFDRVRATMVIDEIAVVKRYDPRPVPSRRPVESPGWQKLFTK